tara:strand:- start:49 stop:237 length:189 start_codon:yes stop_codon:yes gene_type:complete
VAFLQATISYFVGVNQNHSNEKFQLQSVEGLVKVRILLPPELEAAPSISIALIIFGLSIPWI